MLISNNAEDKVTHFAEREFIYSEDSFDDSFIGGSVTTTTFSQSEEPWANPDRASVYVESELNLYDGHRKASLDFSVYESDENSKTIEDIMDAKLRVKAIAGFLTQYFNATLKALDAMEESLK